ncbi:DUF983 domain-containing protein [Methylopila sp. M107]|uniref:DUF983 domain-containing protein n=1 Tax=Methylopila sp. M107 TaxID=1101190 RepID=UPI00036B59FE|nr:DUF983 domain-containing protein [Methylopila sp. M107]
MSAAATDLPVEERPIFRSLLRGFACRCPNCGEGRLYRAFLKPVDACEKCGDEMHHQRADDAPPYVVITIVAHVVIGGLLWLEVARQPPVWVHMAIWLPLTIILSLALLPPVKGALIGLQWALRMHGFGGPDPDAAPDGGLKPEAKA